MAYYDQTDFPWQNLEGEPQKLEATGLNYDNAESSSQPPAFNMGENFLGLGDLSRNIDTGLLEVDHHPSPWLILEYRFAELKGQCDFQSLKMDALQQSQAEFSDQIKELRETLKKYAELFESLQEALDQRTNSLRRLQDFISKDLNPFMAIVRDRLELEQNDAVFALQSPLGFDTAQDRLASDVYDEGGQYLEKVVNPGSDA